MAYASIAAQQAARLPSTNISFLPTGRRSVLSRERSNAAEIKARDDYLRSFSTALERERAAGITGFEDYLRSLRGEGSPNLNSEFVSSLVSQATNPIYQMLRRGLRDSYLSAAARGMSRNSGAVQGRARELTSQANLAASQARGQAITNATALQLPAIQSLANYRATVPISDPLVKYTPHNRGIA